MGPGSFWLPSGDSVGGWIGRGENNLVILSEEGFLKPQRHSIPKILSQSHHVKNFPSSSSCTSSSSPRSPLLLSVF